MDVYRYVEFGERSPEELAFRFIEISDMVHVA
jgi:hypothetical protein